MIPSKTHFKNWFLWLESRNEYKDFSILSSNNNDLVAFDAEDWKHFKHMIRRVGAYDCRVCRSNMNELGTSLMESELSRLFIDVEDARKEFKVNQIE